MEVVLLLLRQNMIMFLYLMIGLLLFKGKIVTKTGSGEIGKMLLYQSRKAEEESDPDSVRHRSVVILPTDHPAGAHHGHGWHHRVHEWSSGNDRVGMLSGTGIHEGAGNR